VKASQDVLNEIANTIIKQQELSSENFYDDLLGISGKLGFIQVLLGYTGEKPIYLLTRRGDIGSANILVAAGFHGEEKAGPYGILKFLHTIHPSKLSAVNLSILPLVNPMGFDEGDRMNAQGKNVDRGFCHLTVESQKTTSEGELLMINFSKLLKLAKNGFFSLHEDIRTEKFYTYTFNDSSSPNEVPKAIVIDKKYFDIHPNGEFMGLDVKDGVITNYHDGSFEDLLFHKGVKVSVVTETPGKADFDQRVSANSAIIKFIVNLYTMVTE
jgi:predicted deacylase